MSPAQACRCMCHSCSSSPLAVNTAASLDPILGDSNTATVGQQIPDGSVAFQLTDANGAPLINVPVTFAQGRGSVPLTLSSVSATTDNYGYAYATVTIGSQSGTYDVHATGAGQSYDFSGSVIAQPTINVQNGVVGVVNAAAGNRRNAHRAGFLCRHLRKQFRDFADGVLHCEFPAAFAE